MNQENIPSDAQREQGLSAADLAKALAQNGVPPHASNGTSSDHHDPIAAAKVLRERMFWLAWRRQAVFWLAGCFLFSGLVLLILRQGFREASLGHEGWIALGVLWLLVLPVALFVIGVWRYRRAPSITKLVAVLDEHNQAGGQFLIEAQSPSAVAAWRRTKPRIVLPQYTLKLKEPLLLTGIALGFACIAGFVPVPQPNEQLKLQIDAQVDAMREQVTVLEEEQVLPEPDAAEALDALDAIAQDADASDPASTWESLDHLAMDLLNQASHRAETAKQAFDAALDTQTLAEALGGQGAQPGAANGMSSDQLAEAMGKLAEYAKNAAMDPSIELPPSLAEALAQAAQGETLSTEQMQQLSDLMSQAQGGLKDSLQRMMEGGLLDANQLQTLLDMEAMQIDPQALAKMLSECDGPGCTAGCIGGACEGGSRPGRGGITRGPGHAELTWQDPVSEDAFDLSPKAVTPGALGALDQAMLQGVSRAAPQTEAQASGSSGGALSQSNAGGGHGNRTTLLPRHRSAVRDYFSRTDSSPEKTP